MPEVAGGVVAAEVADQPISTAFRPIFIGVVTGTLVFVITKLLDRAFGFSKR